MRIALLAFLGIAAALVYFVGIPRYHRWERKSQMLTSLRALHDATADYYEDEMRFPPDTPLTPAAPPCAGGEPLYPARPEDWSQGTWKALRWSPILPTPFRYQFVSDHVGGRLTFTARAVGDLDCDGVLSTYERVGFIGASRAVAGQGEDTRAINPGE